MVSFNNILNLFFYIIGTFTYVIFKLIVGKRLETLDIDRRHELYCVKQEQLRGKEELKQFFRNTSPIFRKSNLSTRSDMREANASHSNRQPQICENCLTLQTKVSQRTREMFNLSLEIDKLQKLLKRSNESKQDVRDDVQVQHTSMQTDTVFDFSVGVQTDSTVGQSVSVQTDSSVGKSVSVQTGSSGGESVGKSVSVQTDFSVDVQTIPSVVESVGMQTDPSAGESIGVQTNSLYCKTVGVQTYFDQEGASDTEEPLDEEYSPKIDIVDEILKHFGHDTRMKTNRYNLKILLAKVQAHGFQRLMYQELAFLHRNILAQSAKYFTKYTPVLELARKKFPSLRSSTIKYKYDIVHIFATLDTVLEIKNQELALEKNDSIKNKNKFKELLNAQTQKRISAENKVLEIKAKNERLAKEKK